MQILAFEVHEYNLPNNKERATAKMPTSGKYLSSSRILGYKLKTSICQLEMPRVD